MSEAIYNLLILIDVMIAMQVGGKFLLDQAWYATIRFLTKHDLWDELL